jgi:RNA polymerase sigma factor for flagellar operon FliA
LTGELGAAPNARQLAERLGIDRDTLWRWQRDNSATQPCQLDTSPAHEGAATREQPSEGSDGSEVDEALTREQELAALEAAIRALGNRQRTVLTLYYYEELRLHQIAEVLGVTESRVSQIRTQAIARLREQLRCLR